MPEEEETSSLAQQLANEVVGEDKVITPYKGMSLEALAKEFREGRITEAEIRTELEARAKNGDIGEKTIETTIAQNRRSTIKPPSLPGVGIAEPGSTVKPSKPLTGLSVADVVKGVKQGQYTPQEAYEILTEELDITPARAEAELRIGLGDVKQANPQYKEIADDLNTRGIGKNISEENLMAGVKKRLWSPEDAYKALVVHKHLDPNEAQAMLRLYFGVPGPITPGVSMKKPEITPPSAGSAGMAVGGGGDLGSAPNLNGYDQSAVATLYDAAQKAGFTGDALHRAVATALAESGGNFKAHNQKGEDSRGPMQINVGPGAHPHLAGEDLFDPYVAMRNAFNISSKGTDFSPWTVWHANRGAPAATLFQQLSRTGSGVQLRPPEPVIPTQSVSTIQRPAGVMLGGPLDQSNLAAAYDGV